MTTLPTLKSICLLALAIATTAPLAATKADVDAAMRSGGLEKINVKGIELAYARPGASLAAYKRVKIDPVEVQFDKSWDPTRTGSRIKLSTQERDKIKADVARIVEEEFTKALQKDGAYQIAGDSAPDVLRVKASILNLYVNAPSGSATSGRSRTYASSAGQMTLLAELVDSAGGQVIARVADRREANGSIPRMQTADTILNEGEARRVAASWAQILRKAMDRARSIGS